MSPTACPELSCEAGKAAQESEPCRVMLCKTSLHLLSLCSCRVISRERDKRPQLPREQSDFHKALLSIWQPVCQMVTKGGAEDTCDDNNIFYWVDTNLSQIITSIF